MIRPLMPEASFWQGKRVFLTGHSGFKGAWLTLWLQSLGVEVAGYSLAPDTTPNLYTILDIPTCCAENHIGDIRDYETLKKAMADFAPELVIHMAAQPLVRRSYREPLETIATNAVGTAHVLEASRDIKPLRGILIVTTDKCYKNIETTKPYVEDDALGGKDIYSASKACAEIITAAYRQSFFAGSAVSVVTARAGNVIGGGDWSEDRLIPDAVRAVAQAQELIIRSPESVRPWQHVAEALAGYLMLARAMFETPATISPAYNFGPDKAAIADVRQVIETFAGYMGVKWRVEKQANAPHEATLLSLDASLAKKELGWHPRFTLVQALADTAHWYSDYYRKMSAAELKKRMLATCNSFTDKDELYAT